MTNSIKIKKIFGDTLKELRTSQNLTQEQLAEDMGIQAQSIGQIEIGRTFVSSEMLSNLSNYFKVDPSIFFTNKVRIISEKDLEYIEEITRLLPTFNSNKLKEIYDILLAIKNNV